MSKTLALQRRPAAMRAALSLGPATLGLAACAMAKRRVALKPDDVKVSTTVNWHGVHVEVGRAGSKRRGELGTATGLRGVVAVLRSPP